MGTRGHQTDMGTPDRHGYTRQTWLHQTDTRTLGKLGHGNTQMHSDTSDTLNIWTFNLSNLDTGTLRLFLQLASGTVREALDGCRAYCCDSRPIMHCVCR